MYPDKIGRYEIKAELGRGGMATVYHAYDPMFEREVALKVLPREMMHDEQFRGRFEREAKIIARLEHATIVPVYDVGQENDQPYFVMRYMAGASLSERMETAPVSLAETARIILRVAAALDYAHSKGIIHRDLKPANILFDETGDPFISDYGIAKFSQSQTNLTGGRIMGTPTYMSPEQAQGDEIDNRSDIYSLGVIVYEMLSGKPPYEANTPLGLVFKHVSDPIPHILDINPDLPVATEAVIEKAMAKSPANRFATAMDLASALAALAHGEMPDLDRTAPVSIHMYNPAGKPPVAVTGKSSFNPPIWISGVIGMFIVAALIWGGIRFSAQADSATTAASPTAESDPVVPVESTPSLAPAPGVGGADKIAVVSGNNIWMTNIDGSDATQLTSDAKPKFDLQWLQDRNNLLYAQEKCLYTLDVTTQKVSRVTCFDKASFFESFRVSPDGKQAAISIDRLVFIVPFDLEILAGIHAANALDELNGCLSYRAIAAKNVLWSKDGQKLAVLYLLGQQDGRVADTIRVLDIHRCREIDPPVLDEFPAGRFFPENYTDNLTLPSFSWDGSDLFLFNSFKRNDGYGPLYTYGLAIGQEKKINPVLNLCCYRDARFSPDGNYMIFAFQDLSQGADSQTLAYYIPLKDVGSDKIFEPLKFPFNFFANPREKPQFALRPAAP
jgi:serine/threonine protein kinase